MRFEAHSKARFAWRCGFCILGTIGALMGCSSGSGGSPDISPYWTWNGVVAADFNNDNRIDVAVAQTYVSSAPPHPGYVAVYLQDATGAFDPPVQYAVGPDPWGMSAGDFDGDGRLDLVVATPATVPPQINVINNSGVIVILRQDPMRPGSFLQSQTFSTGGSATDAAIARLTGDNLADIVVADGVLVNGRALLLAQDPLSPGWLLPPVALPAGSGRGSEDVAVADVNGDGLTDIVLAAYNSVAVFYQRAGGGFDPAVILPAGIRAQGVAVADLDGDQRADIVAANAGNAPAGGIGGASVTVLLQTNPGNFVASAIPVADGARRIAIADFNGDGVPDLAVISLVYAAQSPSRLSVLLQSKVNRGQFGVSAVFNGPFSGNFIAAVDINNDGFNDIIVNEGPSVFLQSATAPGTFGPMRPLR